MAPSIGRVGENLYPLTMHTSMRPPADTNPAENLSPRNTELGGGSGPVRSFLVLLTAFLGLSLVSLILFGLFQWIPSDWSIEALESALLRHYRLPG